MYLDSKRLETYLHCPRKYRYIYEDHLVKPITDDELFEDVLRQHIRETLKERGGMGGNLDPAAICEQFVLRWHSAVAKHNPCGQRGQPDINGIERQGVKIVEEFIKSDHGVMPPDEIGVDFSIGIQEHRVCGYYDRLDQDEEEKYIVTIYTLEDRNPNWEVIENDLRFTIGALDVQRRCGELPIKLVLVDLKDLSEEETERAEWDTYHLEHRIVPHVGDAIQRKQFSPRLGPHCMACKFRERCFQEKHSA